MLVPDWLINSHVTQITRSDWLIFTDASFSVTYGTWYHVVTTRDEDENAKLYVNGDLIGEITDSKQIPKTGILILGQVL